MASGTGTRGPYAKTEARRAEILRTALEAFSVRGFQGSSLREIAEAVGLSQAGVLHHFSSKEALLAAVLAEKDAASVAHFADVSGVGILDALRAVVAENLAQPGLIRLFTTLSAEAINEETPWSRGSGTGMSARRSTSTRPRRCCWPSWTGCRCSGCSTSSSTCSAPSTSFSTPSAAPSPPPDPPASRTVGGQRVRVQLDVPAVGGGAEPVQPWGTENRAE
jgi:hypothetical protein